MGTLVDGTIDTVDIGGQYKLATAGTCAAWIRIQVKAGSTGAIVVGELDTVKETASGRRGVVLAEVGTDGANGVREVLIEGPLDIGRLAIASTAAAETVHFLYMTYP